MASVESYTSLVTTQHRDKPNFMAMLGVNCQPFVDIMNELLQLPARFDIDVAIGQQLDYIGQWVGASRNLSTPIAGIYFAWDITNVGWDQGVWKSPSDPAAGTVVLPDEYYRLLLKAKILNNHWDCDIADAYTLMNATFAPLGYFVAIKDNGNLTMDMILVGSKTPDTLLWAMFTSGLLDIRPIGVRVNGYSHVPRLDLLDTTFILDTSQLA